MGCDCSSRFTGLRGSMFGWVRVWYSYESLCVVYYVLVTLCNFLRIELLCVKLFLWHCSTVCVVVDKTAVMAGASSASIY